MSGPVDAAKAVSGGDEPRHTRRRGKVTGVAGVGGSPATCEVDVGNSGVSVPMRYLASYAPSTNDQVIVDWVGGDPYVTGKLA